MLCGEFSGWTPIPMTLQDGTWHHHLLLGAGRYQYKFVVDGEWMFDMAKPVMCAQHFVNNYCDVEAGNVWVLVLSRLLPVNGDVLELLPAVQDTLQRWEGLLRQQPFQSPVRKQIKFVGNRQLDGEK